jgi:hypothetical protein
MRFMYAAYVITWVVHIVYIIWMTVKFREATREAEELLRESKKDL